MMVEWFGKVFSRWNILVVVVASVLIVSGLLMARPEIELWLAMKGNRSPQPAHPSIVMLGDSHTHFVNWRMLMHCENIVNSGIGGNTTAQILDRLESIIDARPKLVVMMAGTNDALQNVTSKQIAANLRNIEHKFETNGIAYISLTPPPLPSNEDGIQISAHLATLKIPFLSSDLLSDKVHLRRSGYAKWRDAISEKVKEYCH